MIATWFAGKALSVLTDYTLPTLAAAEARGYWDPHESRKVRASLNKQRPAEKFARANEKLLESIPDAPRPAGSQPRWTAGPGWSAAHAMRYGAVMSAPEVLASIQGLRSRATTADQRQALDHVERWARDFAPVADLLSLLDSRRPKPTFVMGSLSPSVVANLGTSLGIAFDTVRVPEMEGRWVDVTVKGRAQRAWIVVIKWPANTVHGASRFVHGSRAGNSQCEACGHAIKDPFNWVPLLADVTGRPHSLWVGRDCARKLFAVDIKGDCQYEGRE
jgi:hypothetical protein